jgi:uncharacterized repeat protein (TIGR04138 family)
VARLRARASEGPYSLAAYDFVLRGLDRTIRSLPEVRHVSGQELVHGIESFAKDEFGPMAKHVLNSWGLTRTRDFGEIVFELVEQGVLRKTDEDSIEDFADGFDFTEAFERNYYKDHPVLSG